MEEHVLRYTAVYNQLKADLFGGRYSPGTLLPPERELMELYRASRTTVRRAVGMLKEQGLVSVQQGRGTEVLPHRGFPARFRSYEQNLSGLRAVFLGDGPHQVSSQEVVIDSVPAEAHVVEALGIAPGSPVYRLQRLFLVDGRVFGYMVNYLRADLVPGLDKSGQVRQLHYYLKENYGITMDSAQETVGASIAGIVEAKLLGLEPGAPILVFHRVSYQGDTPVEHSDTYVRADICRLSVTLAGSPPQWFEDKDRPRAAEQADAPPQP